MHFGIPAPFSQAQRLILPASRGIEPALVDLNMAGIHVNRLAFLSRSNLLPQSFPESVAAPTAVILGNDIPVCPRAINRTPGAAVHEDKKDAGEHDFRSQRRAPAATFRKSMGLTS